MSDQQYVGAAPGGYPPQQGGMAPPPPPPPPPGLFPQQSATAPAPKKRRVGLIIGIVAAVLLLCALGSCVALIGFGVIGGSGQRATVAQAEQHFSAALSSVATASAAVKEAVGADDAKATAAVDSADKALRNGRDEIAAARAAIEGLDASQGKDDYLASLTSATEALDALQDLVAYMGTATDMASKVDEAGTTGSKAISDLSAAIKSGNSNAYSRMKRQAQAASAGFAKAALLLRDAAKLDTSVGLDKAAAYMDKRKAEADLTVKMADEGKAGKMSAYNADIKRVKTLRAQAAAIGTPAIVEDPQWVEKRLETLSTQITDAAQKADQLRTKALQELGAG